MEVTKLKNISVPENIEEYGEDDETKLPGFRFHPTDEELVGFYLKRKVEKRPIIIDLIKQFDIYKYDPWDLPISTVGDREWYFFCLRGRKYRNSIRPNRVTGSGFWKATGIDKPIYSSLKESSLHHHHHHHHYHQNDQRSIIGLKKSLVYYRGSAGKGTKTDWMMHEFRLPSNTSNNTNTTTTTTPNLALEAEVWTLCRIFKRIPSHKKYIPADLKEASTRKCQSDHSSFKTSSYESNYSIKLDSSVSVMKQYKQRKPAIFEQFDETNNNNCFVGQFRPAMTMIQPQFPASYSSLLNPINEHHDESWDELRSVVQLAFDPPQTIL